MVDQGPWLRGCGRKWHTLSGTRSFICTHPRGRDWPASLAATSHVGIFGSCRFSNTVVHRPGIGPSKDSWVPCLLLIFFFLSLLPPPQI